MKVKRLKDLEAGLKGWEAKKKEMGQSTGDSKYLSP